MNSLTCLSGRLRGGLFSVALLGAAALMPADAQGAGRGGMYAGLDLGLVFPGRLATQGMDTDVQTLCDELIPVPMRADGTLVPRPSSSMCQSGGGDGWTNSLDFGRGVMGGVQLGWFHNNFRFELEYAYSAYDGDRGPIDGLIAGKENEFVYQNEKFENITSHDFFINGYVDLQVGARFTPYIGFGLGWRRMELDYTGTFIRNTYDVFNNNPALADRRNAAGTLSYTEEKLDDDLFGYQLIIGGDYAVDERLTVGAKFRYMRFDEFDGGYTSSDFLRSHDSIVRVGGVDRPVVNKVETDKMDNWVVSLNLKYAFAGGADVGGASGAAAGADRDGMYVGLDLGMVFPEDIDSEAGDNDVGTGCDSHIFNPPLETDPAVCGSGDSWSNSFNPDTGLLGGVHVGWFHGNLRTELEYFHWAADGDSGPIEDFNDFTGKNAEFQFQNESVDNITAHNLFANVYYDFASHSRFTPYLGAGLGWQKISFDYTGIFLRNTRAVFEDPRNGLTARTAAAGTVTHIEKELDDDMFGYQLMAGVDYALTERLMLGGKLRYMRFDDFDGGRHEYDQLRSHESRTTDPVSDPGNPNSRVVRHRFEIDELETWALSLNLKYLF